MDTTTLPRTATARVPGTTAAQPDLTAPAPATQTPASRVQRLWRGPQDDPSWARPALLGLLLATAVLYLYNLTSSGYANSFYSAAVQAGSASWKAFLYGSSDAGNSITATSRPPRSGSWRCQYGPLG